MAEDAPKRVLLKLSGEALMGALPYGIDPAMLDTIAGQLKAVQSMGIEVAIVVGAGNFFRGATASATGMQRAPLPPAAPPAPAAVAAAGYPPPRGGGGAGRRGGPGRPAVGGGWPGPNAG